MAAIQGQLSMDFGTALQTFGAGALELKLAMIATSNPLLMTAAGMQNILAGLIATWNTFSVYVDPLDLFGGAGISALLGFGMARGLLAENMTDATRDAIRSGVIGALYSVSAAFGYGALAGFVVCRLGHALAGRHNALAQNRLSVDPHSYRLLVETLISGKTEISEFLVATKPNWLAIDRPKLPGTAPGLPSSARPLTGSGSILNDDFITLPDKARTIPSKTFRLPEEPNGLFNLYRSALLSSNTRRTTGMAN